MKFIACTGNKEDNEFGTMAEVRSLVTGLFVTNKINKQKCLFVLLIKVYDLFCDNFFLLFFTRKSYHVTNPNIYPLPHVKLSVKFLIQYPTYNIFSF